MTDTSNSPNLFLTVLTAIGGWISYLFLVGTVAAMSGFSGSFDQIIIFISIISCLAGLYMRREGEGIFIQQMATAAICCGMVTFYIFLDDVFKAPLAAIIILTLYWFALIKSERTTPLMGITFLILSMSAFMHFVGPAMQAITLFGMDGFENIFWIKYILIVSIVIASMMVSLLKPFKGYDFYTVGIASCLALFPMFEVLSSIPLKEMPIWFYVLDTIMILPTTGLLYIARDHFSTRQISITIVSYIVFLYLLPPTFALGLTMILFGYCLDKKLLSILGTIVSIYGVSKYYYDLNISLMEKSYLISAAGIVCLLLAYFLLHNKERSNEV